MLSRSFCSAVCLSAQFSEMSRALASPFSLSRARQIRLKTSFRYADALADKCKQSYFSFRSICTLPAQPSKIFFYFAFEHPHHTAAANQRRQLACLRLPSYRPLAHAKNPFQLGQTDQPVIKFIFRVHLHPSISIAFHFCPTPFLFPVASDKIQPSFCQTPSPPSPRPAVKTYPADGFPCSMAPHIGLSGSPCPSGRCLQSLGLPRLPSRFLAHPPSPPV